MIHLSAILKQQNVSSLPITGMETPLLFISMPQNGGEVIMHIFSIFIPRHRPRYESTIVSSILNHRLSRKVTDWKFIGCIRTTFQIDLQFSRCSNLARCHGCAISDRESCNGNRSREICYSFPSRSRGNPYITAHAYIVIFFNGRKVVNSDARDRIILSDVFQFSI